jgi:predicted N-acetyltransferase YhbS
MLTVPLVLSRRYEGPRMARPGEGREILSLISRVFPGGGDMGRGWTMLREYPHLYGDMEARLDTCFVIRHEGRIVSHCGVYPLEFVAGPSRVLCGGIGAVATLGAYRGQGMMAALLDYCTDYMRHHGMPVSILWGDRTRYARLGWEPAGRQLSFRVYPRTAEALRRFDDRVVELRCPETRAAELHALHRGLPVRVERSTADFPLILRKHGRRVFAAVRGRRIVAYALASSRGGRTELKWSVEEVAGSAEGVLSLYRWFAARPGCARVSGVVPIAALPYVRALFGAMDFWSSSIGCLGQIKIVDRAGLLRAFRVPSLDGTVGRLRLNGLEQSRLLFGPLPPRALLPAGRSLAAVDRHLPLPFFLWPTDHV